MQSNLDVPKALSGLMAAAPGGFAIGLHVRFTNPTFMFETYPRAWHEEYSRDGLLLRDPMIHWSFSNQGHIAWGDLAHLDEAGVLARAASHGLNHGVAVSILRGGSRSIGGFARTDRAFTADEAATLEQAMADLHDSTASTTELPEEVRESLRRLSIAFTHP